jgi:hypothetical protein
MKAVNLIWRGRACMAAALAAFASLQPLTSAAQGDPWSGPWHYRATLYGYFPSVSGHSSFPVEGGGSTIDADTDKLVDSIDGVFMGAFEAHNGRWGVFTDYMYLNLSGSRQNSRDFSINNGAIDVGTSADLGWGLKGSIWTLAGEYRLQSAAPLTVDLLAGARMFKLEPSMRWNISGSIGSLPPASRSGSVSSSDTLWDGIVGVRGRYALGASQQWVVPFYLDVGTGNSKLTWQAAGGLGYAFSWGEISLLWRYLSYEMKNGNPQNELHFNGPMLGATFAF